MGPAEHNVVPFEDEYRDAATKPVIASVLADFRRRNISYCYWKSTGKLASVLAGAGDLDLLIAREDQHRAQEILLSHDCKLFISAGAREPPSVSTYLGYDPVSGRIVHFHLHIRLLVGPPMSPPWRLPWEDTLLARAVPDPGTGVMRLDPASEALLLLARRCIELQSLDPTSMGRRSTIDTEFERCRLDLLARVDPNQLQALASALLSPSLGESAVESLRLGAHAERHSPFFMGITRCLAEWPRAYGPVESCFRSWARIALAIAERVNARVLHAPRPWKRHPLGGGLVIAVVGVDGSGKSTLVFALKDWLGRKVDVLPLYFGTGDGTPSLVLRPFKWLMRPATALVGRKPSVASHGRTSDGPPRLMYRLLLAVWACAVAADKKTKLTAARRAAARGIVVISDRYPQNETRLFNDGPLLARLPTAPMWLRRMETAVYEDARKHPPDLVLKLVARPETLAGREPALELGLIASRLEALASLKFGGAVTVVIDAERPLDEMVANAKRAIWRLL